MPSLAFFPSHTSSLVPAPRKLPSDFTVAPFRRMIATVAVVRSFVVTVNGTRNESYGASTSGSNGLGPTAPSVNPGGVESVTTRAESLTEFGPSVTVTSNWYVPFAIGPGFQDAVNGTATGNAADGIGVAIRIWPDTSVTVTRTVTESPAPPGVNVTLVESWIPSPFGEKFAYRTSSALNVGSASAAPENASPDSMVSAARRMGRSSSRRIVPMIVRDPLGAREARALMPNTREILDQMFINLVKVKLDADILEKMVPVVDGLLERLRGGLEIESEQSWNRLRIALAGMLAHGWALGMNPFNSPNTHIDGDRVEVRVSRDILVPNEVLKSLRYVKRDDKGRIEKALFEPSAEARIKEQIDIMLRTIEKKHWKD